MWWILLSAICVVDSVRKVLHRVQTNYEQREGHMMPSRIGIFRILQDSLERVRMVHFD
jgi:hypothetical protein